MLVFLFLTESIVHSSAADGEGVNAKGTQCKDSIRHAISYLTITAMVKMGI